MNDLYRTAVRYLSDSAAAADAVQEAYLLAWMSFHRYERNTNCRAWLFRILFNVVRKRRRLWRKHCLPAEDILAAQNLVSPDPIPTVLTDDAILSALDKIPDKFRKVLLLVDVDEFSYKEVSSRIGIPIGTVMSRLSRGRKLLRAEITSAAANRVCRPPV